MLRECPKDAPWNIEIDVDEKADLNCIAEIDTEKIQGLFLHFSAKFSELDFIKKIPTLQVLRLYHQKTKDLTEFSSL